MTTRSGNSVSNALPGTRRDTMRRPGATRSGLAFESALPQAENQASMSSPRPRVPRSSVAPTVITYGSMPGVRTVSRCGPPFPDAATTTRPRRPDVGGGANRVAPRSGRRRRVGERRTAAPRDLHRRRHRVDAVGKVGRRAEREIDDADVVGDAVREDPLDPPYHRGDATASGGAEHPDVDDVGLRSDADELAAGAAAIPGDDPGDMSSMPARVAREALIGEVDRGEYTVVGLDEIRIRGDARIQDCDRHASPGYPLLPDLIGSHHPRVDP